MNLTVPVCLLAATLTANPCWSADWNAETQREYAGTYSTDCANPGAPRARAEPHALMVEVGRQRMTGNNVQIAFSLFGQQLEPAGQQTIALMSQVHGLDLSFYVRRDVRGQSITLQGDPKVMAALGKGLASQTFRDCDLARSERAAAQMQADLKQARADTAAANRAAQQPDAVRFKTALRRALGAKAREPWLLESIGHPVADTPSVRIAGVAYQELAGCKPHDCGDNNVLVLYEPASGAVYGKLLSKAAPSLFGAPPPSLATEIERRWRAQWRQGQ